MLRPPAPWLSFAQPLAPLTACGWWRITPTDANQIWNMVSEVNPFLMKMLGRLQEVARQALSVKA